MRTERRTFAWVFVVGLLFATVSCGQATEVEGDPIDGSFFVAGAADNIAPDENSAEARAILDVVNTFSLHSLIREVDLYYNGARSVIDYRNGADSIRNSDDDMFVRSMKELDDVPYIGRVSMTRLREYVRDNDLIAGHDIDYETVVPTKVNTKKIAAFRGTIGPRELIRLRLVATVGDRVLLWFRKAGDEKWNPKIKIVDSQTGETVDWANPWGFTDARLPESTQEASRGWEIDREPANYTIVLDNTAKIDGTFEFLMECVGGPCFDADPNQVVLDGDFSGLDDAELRDQMVARHELTHTYLDYYDAREIMFEQLDNDDGVVECVYSGARVHTTTIPSNLIMNAEHTWPQSQGAVDGAARSDLHHLFPVASTVNSLRAAYPYCNVEHVIREVGGSYYGNEPRCFEPRDEHKGNAARAMFYFAAVYQQDIDDKQEAALREWHEFDPVDDEELDRNAAIEAIQGSRNFFVDDPALVDRISNF